MATRVGGVLAVIGTVPSGCGPDLLCGELRTDDDQPVRLGSSKSGPAAAEQGGILVAPNTERGLGLLLTGLQRLVDTRPVHPARRAG